MSKLTPLALLTVFAIALVPASLGAPAAGQEIVVSAHDTALQVTGITHLHPGFVRLRLRNDSRGEHGIELVRLRRALSTRALLTAFAREDAHALESLGGVQEVVAGQPWQMTTKLVAGSYALIDFGQNGPKPNYAHGLLKRFRVAGEGGAGTAPAVIGGIDMRDYRFAFRLPRPFSGRGVLRISNLGRTSHEITLVRVTGGHTAGDVLRLVLAGATQPPQWASIVELLSVLDAHDTAYVNVHLTPGRYVALCLMDDPGSQKLQAQLGMIGTFAVT